MGRKKVAGLINRKGIWHIDKVIRGRRLCESTGESEIERAEEYLARRIEEIRQAEIFGVQAQAGPFGKRQQNISMKRLKHQFVDDARISKCLDPFIGGLALETVHMGSLPAVS